MTPNQKQKFKKDELCEEEVIEEVELTEEEIQEEVKEVEEKIEAYKRLMLKNLKQTSCEIIEEARRIRKSYEVSEDVLEVVAEVVEQSIEKADELTEEQQEEARCLALQKQKMLKY